MLARPLLVTAVLLLVAAAPATAGDAAEDGPHAWYDPTTGSTVLAWTHEPGTVAHVVHRNGQEVARLTPGHTTWSDARPDAVTSYRVDSLRPDGSARSLDFVVFVSPWQGHAPPVPSPSVPFLSSPLLEPEFRGLPVSCTWISVMRDPEPLFVRYQEDPACSPLPPVFEGPGGGVVDMDTFLD